MASNPLETRVTVRIAQDTRKELQKMASADGRTENNYLRHVLVGHVQAEKTKKLLARTGASAK